MNETRLEQLMHQVLDERDFQIRLESSGAGVSVTITDENDPRRGCAQLRGESHADFAGHIRDALVDACEQALRDEYPQATSCGRCVKRIDERWTNCLLAKVHDGPCRDQHGNTETLGGDS